MPRPKQTTNATTAKALTIESNYESDDDESVDSSDEEIQFDHYNEEDNKIHDSDSDSDSDDAESNDEESVDLSEDKIEFSNYFNFEYDIELDSEGRITFLDIDKTNFDNYNLPPIIERLQKLQGIRHRDCQLLPIELSNLPLLKSITFRWCDRALFESIPEGLLLSAFIQVQILYIQQSCSSLSAF